MKKSLIVFWAFVFLLSPLLTFAQWKERPVKKNTEFYRELTVWEGPGEHIYHKIECPLLHDPKSAITMGDAEERGDQPCPSCFIVNVLSPGYIWNFDFRAPIKSKGLLFADGAITVTFVISRSRVLFEIQNMTDSGIKINWDEISFISPTNRASRVVHSGIRFVDKSNPQAPSVVPPKSKISDILIPSENVSYSRGWDVGSLFEGDGSAYNGREFGIYFPIEIKGVKKEYSFRFGISVVPLSPGSK